MQKINGRKHIHEYKQKYIVSLKITVHAAVENFLFLWGARREISYIYQGVSLNRFTW